MKEAIILGALVLFAGVSSTASASRMYESEYVLLDQNHEVIGTIYYPCYGPQVREGTVEGVYYVEGMKIRCGEDTSGGSTPTECFVTIAPGETLEEAISRCMGW